jgi:hypothetical protein
LLTSVLVAVPRLLRNVHGHRDFPLSASGLCTYFGSHLRGMFDASNEYLGFSLREELQCFCLQDISIIPVFAMNERSGE